MHFLHFSVVRFWPLKPIVDAFDCGYRSAWTPWSMCLVYTNHHYIIFHNLSINSSSIGSGYMDHSSLTHDYVTNLTFFNPLSTFSRAWALHDGNTPQELHFLELLFSNHLAFSIWPLSKLFNSLHLTVNKHTHLRDKKFTFCVIYPTLFQMSL